MNLKSFIPLCLLLAFAGGLGAETDLNSPNGWQVAQVQIPTRRVQTPANNSPSGDSPDSRPAPPSPQAPPTMGPPSPATAAKPASTTALPTPHATTSTNDADFDENKADISYDLPAVQVEQLLRSRFPRAAGGPHTFDGWQRSGGHPDNGHRHGSKTESPLTRSEAIVCIGDGSRE